MKTDYEFGITGELVQDVRAENPLKWNKGDRNVLVHINIPRYFEWTSFDSFRRGDEVTRTLLRERMETCDTDGACDDEYRCDGCSIREDFAGFWAFPIFAYVHSGIVFSLGRFSCPWDSGTAGIMLLSKSEWPEVDAAERYADGVIATLNQYCAGDVWGYVIRDAAGEEVDSCWGFYGEEYAREEMNNVAGIHVMAERSRIEDAEKGSVYV